MTTSPDAAAYQMHLLDMGQEKYGDSILCQFGQSVILIDGGHPGDHRSRNGYPSIPDQLHEILQAPPPWKISLLVVTHVHSDHIGCLPTLIADELLDVEWALVADEKLGFGRAHDQDSGPEVDAPSAVRRIVAALREESRADLPDDQLREYLADVEKLEDRYKTMLATLRNRGTRLVRYGRNSHQALVQAFQHIGMRILGPTRDHLVICAEAIAGFNQDALTLAADFPPSDDAGTLGLYRSLAQIAADSLDRPGKGAAINDQSIVLRFEVKGQKILLTGDMQLAKAEVSGLQQEMGALRRTIRQDAPFAFAKLAHHTSYNGFDESVMNEWGDTAVFGHTGGRQDATHPDPAVLRLLKNNRPRVQWARTDRNGLVTVSIRSNGIELHKTRGRLNDATPNSLDQPIQLSQPVELAPSGSHELVPVRAAHTINADETVEVITRIPHRSTKVTVTVDVEPRDGRGRVAGQSVENAEPSARGSAGRAPAVERVDPRGPLPALNIAGGRRLPPLLFVTSREGLAQSIGRAECDHVLATLRSAGQKVFDGIPRDARLASDAARLTGPQIDADCRGVVILGGHDVAPAQKLDVLDPQLRASVAASYRDPDDFLVWSDAIYGDRDGDGLPEVPVSRIPDGKSPQLVFAALQANGAVEPKRFGIRNVHRPFAEEVFRLLPGEDALLISEKTVPQDVQHDDVVDAALYFMLHGADYDGSRFWGEDDNGNLEAFNLSNIPARCNGIVFTGCCWGALCVETTAAQSTHGQKIAQMTPDASIALSFLKAGVRALVGCTGAHYSPDAPPYNFFGGPMHRAFWRHIRAGEAPAEALFRAKIEYLDGMPFGQTSPLGRAIGMKILRQFVCLGLGW